MNYKISLKVMLFSMLLLWVPALEYRVLSKSSGTQEDRLGRPDRLDRRPSLAQIKQRLRQVAERRLRERGGTLTGEASEFLQATLDGGAARVYADGATRDLIKKAENNTIKLVDELIGDGIPRGSRLELNRETVRKSWRRLCPLYPFC